MRVLFVNTSEQTGGAAVATGRLLAALNNNGEKAMMLVRDKQTGNLCVARTPHRWLMLCRFAWERLLIFLHLRLRREHLWEIDTAQCGTDITRLREFREADIIHLAWVNQGMLSIGDISKIVGSGKPVVWTMHDLWPATALCHYARGCTSFVSGCRRCRLLPRQSLTGDLAARTWKRKKRVYSRSDIHFVACSRWLESQANQSGLLAGMSVTSIPNPIDTNVFCPADKLEARRMLGLPADNDVILFAAQNVTDERKGVRYLIEAIEKLRAFDPDTARNTVVALLGGNSEALAREISLPAYPLGYVSGDHNLARAYNAADVFVLPSQEDNLPNTLMEALACGVPCVGFNVGGIPEMIDHKQNGYIARKGDSLDLATGLQWVLAGAAPDSLRKEAVAKVAKCYSQQSVAHKYIEVYAQVLAQKRVRA